jgi:hypothetical protein
MRKHLVRAAAIVCALSPSISRAQPPPVLSAGPYETPEIGALDAQIAAGPRFLVGASSGRLGFYDKATGALITADKSGNPFNGAPTARKFFQPLWDKATSHGATINDGLNLPTGLRCDPLDPNSDAANNFCIDDYYDLRVAFDMYRKVFWVVASARNSNARCDKVHTPMPAASLAARRSKLLYAVSRTGDPRDGWRMFLWDAIADDGVCSSTTKCPGSKSFQPGDGADFPELAITEKFAIVTIRVNHRDPAQMCADDFKGKTGIAHVWDADQIVEGKWPSCGGNCRWAYWDVPDSAGKPFVKLNPAKQRGTNALANSAWIVAESGNDPLTLIGMPMDQGPKPALVQLPIPIDRLHPPSGWSSVPQQSSASIPQPPNYKTVAYAQAVHREGRTFVAWAQCNSVLPPSFDMCFPGASTRVVGLDLVSSVFGPALDIVITPVSLAAGNALADPALEVNSLGDVFVSHTTAGPTMFPTAGYSVLRHGESAFRTGGILAGGTSPTGCSGASCTPLSDVDIHSAALDTDGTSFWLIQPHGELGPEVVPAGVLKTSVGRVPAP